MRPKKLIGKHNKILEIDFKNVRKIKATTAFCETV